MKTFLHIISYKDATHDRVRITTATRLSVYNVVESVSDDYNL